MISTIRHLRLSGFRALPLVLVLTLTPCFFLLPYVEAADGAGDIFAPLKERLIGDGFAPELVDSAYTPDIRPYFKTIANSFQVRESKLNYAQFLEPYAIDRARQFLRKHESSFARAEKAQGVDRSVIAAILLVETQLGQFTGNVSTLAILSSFALMDLKSYQDEVWALMPYETRQEWGSYLFDRKLTTRAEWAYGELSALMRWASSNPGRLGALRGSYMGAIGWPQFLPSSLLRFGADGNSDGEVDLFNPADAIMSTASYLKGHGWRDGLSRAEQEEVVYQYNHSRPYVKTILDAAEKLRH